jgi:hypothetical protein
MVMQLEVRLLDHLQDCSEDSLGKAISFVPDISFD